MGVRQPKQQIRIRRGEEVKPRVEPHDRRLPLLRQRPRRVQDLAAVRRRRLERVPHEDILLSRPADDKPSVWGEAAVAAALELAAAAATAHASLANRQPAGTQAAGPTQESLEGALEGVEEEVAAAAGAEEEGLAIVGELELGPAADNMTRVKGAALIDDVDCSEWCLVIVSGVVEEYGAGAGAPDGEDGTGGVVGGEIW